MFSNKRMWNSQFTLKCKMYIVSSGTRKYFTIFYIRVKCKTKNYKIDELKYFVQTILFAIQLTGVKH